MDDASGKLNSAKEVTSNANTVLTNATSTLADAQKVQSIVQFSLDDLKKVQSEKEETVTSKQSTYDTVKEKADAYQELVAKINTTESEITNTQKSIETLNDTIDKANAKVVDDKTQIEELTAQLKVRRADKGVFTNLQYVLSCVLSKGTQADLSSVEGEDLLAKFTQLAKDVDVLNVAKAKLESVNEDYKAQYKVWISAQEDLADAQGEYEDALRLLDEYLTDQAKHVNKETTEVKKTEDVKQTSGVNTGVAANAMTSITMMGIAGLGIVEAKKRSKRD